MDPTSAGVGGSMERKRGPDGLDVVSRDMLIGLERTRLDVTFLGALIDDTADASTARTIAGILGRLDGIIAQLAGRAESHA
jgi:hypothetical protein